MNAEVYCKEHTDCESMYFNADTGNLVVLYVDTFDIGVYDNGEKLESIMREIELTAEQAAGFLVQPHYHEHDCGAENVIGLKGGCKLLHTSAGGWFLYF